MNTPDLVNEILLKAQALIMKSIMKALNILNEIFNETAQHWLWKMQKHPILLMKYSMKAHSINYERGNKYTWPNGWNITESAKGWLWKVQWKNAALILKNVMKAPNIPNEIFNERIQH